jgi:hypothetical protein
VADMKHFNYSTFIIDFINYAVIANLYAPAGPALNFLQPGGLWL